jgi:hypothetical protein
MSYDIAGCFDVTSAGQYGSHPGAAGCAKPVVPSTVGIGHGTVVAVDEVEAM